MKESSFNKKESEPEQGGPVAEDTGHMPWNWMLFPFSSVKAGPDSLFAASVGYGVYEISQDGRWEKLADGLADHVSVNRLQLQEDMLLACTNEGLFQFEGDEWTNTGLSYPCYQYRMLGNVGYAATDYGLWSQTGGRWEQSACPDKRVYDFFNMPQYLIIGHESGISMYDRFMDEWAEFELKRTVTSLAIFKGHLLGASDKGELLVGDKQGRFDRIRFGNHFIFSLVTKGSSVFVCTDHGLFRLSYIREQIVLLSVKPGIPVTDMDIDADSGNLHVATIFQGIQSIEI